MLTAYKLNHHPHLKGRELGYNGEYPVEKIWQKASMNGFLQNIYQTTEVICFKSFSIMLKCVRTYCKRK